MGGRGREGEGDRGGTKRVEEGEREDGRLGMEEEKRAFAGRASVGGVGMAVMLHWCC